MIKAVIFDLDGVIAVSGKRFSDRLGEDYGVSKEHQREFFEGKFQDLLVGKGDLKEDIKEHAKRWGWKGTIEELLDYWFQGEHHVDERVLEAIRDLRARGLKAYMATNQEEYRTGYIASEMGLEDVFDGIFSSARVGHIKTDPRFWQYVLKEVSLDPAKVLFWDDSRSNVEVAASAGIRAELYTTFENFRKKLSASLQDKTFTSV